MASKTNPAIDFGNDDFNPNQFSYQTAQQDGILMGRLLMREEVLRLIKATNPVPTKAVAKILDLVEGLNADVYASEASR
ncbi:hypothetical protein UFOVP692_30 [uncultured Caudovirales phage]|jgi:hypothetical protein|uniref:Uncharacterized protein n=1 Tax=uncultured Caudovirales phage TaxID=2100421 RepID=A0A6J5NJC5_9CAUD|nr:hypothetical protein UFOVP692_30 [uncultured Caudovirales phage]